MPSAKMLPYYAERFPTVEINYTFYRTPNEKILDGWNSATPERFKLTLKAPQADHPRRAAARLRRPRSPVPRDRRQPRTEARRAAVSAAAEPEEGPRALRRLSRGVSAARLRGVRVPSRVVARRGGVRAAARAQPGALRRRQREALDAGRDHGRLRLLPAARRGLRGRRHRALGRTIIRRRTSALPRRLRLFQARRGREGAGVRADADGPVCVRRNPNRTISRSAQ